ncbi:hypothetical protein L0Y34_00125 [Candidatus Parcubacteria bacterium]|nr:hypothetical protein [Candidatus Parcubacteria bacterium]
MFVVRRHHENPLLAPRREHPWEALATFNPSVVRTEVGFPTKKPVTRMYFRALANPAALIAPFAGQSTIGMASSEDGVHFHSERQVIVPKESWEAFGCEDPRATVIDGITYLAYTALGGYPFGPDNIKAALAISRDGEHFTERHLLTPFNAKAFALFPEKINGEHVAIVTAHTDWTADHPRPTTGIARAKEIEEFWNPNFWHLWHKDLESHGLQNLRRADEDHVEVGAPPIHTKDGWLLIYSYIQQYYDEHTRTFGVEAALLDRDDPRKLIARSYPFMVPEEVYERFGIVPNIVFPTSVLENKDGSIDIFYGAADTTCAKATVRLDDLLDSINAAVSPTLTRAKHNPIITPIKDHAFESKLTFNPAAIDVGGDIHLLYRAMSDDNTSTIGYARSKDGIHIHERLSVPVYGPRAEFEMKLGGGNEFSGCEDPRTVVIDDTLYMTYTAYTGRHSPRGAITSISIEDFLARRFENWTQPFLVTPDGVDDKDLALLPGKVEENYLLYHRVSGRICADLLPSLSGGVRVSRCIEIMGPREGMWDATKVGVAAPPLKVEGGWLLLYHGVSRSLKYRVGVALLDESGTTVIARSADPILEPVEPYEQEGEIPMVVFPCGAVIRDDTLFVYYGGADKVVGVATGSVSRILKALTWQ